MPNGMSPLLLLYRSVSCLTILLCYTYTLLPLPQPLTITYFTVLLVSIDLPFPESHIVEIVQEVAFLEWRLSLIHMHLMPSMPFYGLRTHFFLVLDNPLPGPTTVYVSIYQRKT